jgi:hypothetical protein
LFSNHLKQDAEKDAKLNRVLDAKLNRHFLNQKLDRTVSRFAVAFQAQHNTIAEA